MSSYIGRVAKFEITRQLKKPAFWAATLLIPILIGAVYFISFVTSSGNDKEPEYDDQSKIAIGSGGLTGKGFLNGTQTKYNPSYQICSSAEP